MTYNLLQTDGGSELSPELVLLIVEFIDYSPDQINTLMTLSKSFRGLLLNRERSITNRIYNAQIQLQPKCTRRITISCCDTCVALAENLRAEVTEIASRKGPIIPSTVRQGLLRMLLMPDTYSWLSELSFRKHVNTTLLKSSFMKNLTSNHHVQDGLPLELFLASNSSFQLRALDLLYAFAECTVSGEPSGAQDLIKHSSTCNSYELRKSQESYLLQLSPQLLALLGMSAATISAQYLVSEAISRPSEMLSIQDEQLVFEERLLLHGPFFLWGYVAGSPVVKDWMRSEIKQGMQEMRDFESGKENCLPSLQSMLGRIFCMKVQCDNFPGRWSWMAAEVDRLVELGCL